MQIRSFVAVSAFVLLATTGIQAAPLIVNKGVRVTKGLVADGPHVVMLLDEDGQVDLDGNGAFNDDVLHVHHRPTQTTTNLGQPAAEGVRPAIHNGLIAFGMPESAAGVGDRNGDGDLLDAVIHVHDIATGTTTSTGVAVANLAEVHMEGDLVVIRVSENAQNGDLNADGDQSDQVLHVFRPGWGAARNLGYSVGGAADADQLQFDRDSLLFVADEVTNGADLNNDGDQTDYVLMHYDVATAVTKNLGLSGSLADWHSTEMVDRDPRRYRASTVAFLASESDSAGVDMNQDGDTLDDVLVAVDTTLAIPHILGYAASRPSVARNDDEYIAFSCFESWHGADLNGDQDLFDVILVVHDLTTGVTSSTGQPITPDWQGGTDVVGSRAEWMLGADLNQDGDQQDFVQTHYDIATGTVTNLGVVASSLSFAIAGSHYLMRVLESHQGVDLNGDLDLDDAVLHHLDLSTLTMTNLGVASNASYAATHLRNNTVAVKVRESTHGNVDRNGDGDTNDDIVFAVDLATMQVFDTGLAVGFTYPFALHNQRLYVLVNEAMQGQDLDGDGDQGDDVMHVIRF